MFLVFAVLEPNKESGSTHLGFEGIRGFWSSPKEKGQTQVGSRRYMVGYMAEAAEFLEVQSSQPSDCQVARQAERS